MQGEMFGEDLLDVVCPGGRHKCGSRGIIHERGLKHCSVCGRAISIKGTFVVPARDNGDVSRRLAEYRLEKIMELQRLLSPGKEDR